MMYVGYTAFCRKNFLKKLSSGKMLRANAKVLMSRIKYLFIQMNDFLKKNEACRYEMNSVTVLRMRLNESKDMFNYFANCPNERYNRNFQTYY